MFITQSDAIFSKEIKNAPQNGKHLSSIQNVHVDSKSDYLLLQIYVHIQSQHFFRKFHFLHDVNLN